MLWHYVEVVIRAYITIRLNSAEHRMNHTTLDTGHDATTTSLILTSQHIIPIELNIAGGSIIFYYENTHICIFLAHIDESENQK